MSYIHLDVEEILRETDSAFLLLPQKPGLSAAVAV